jgi:NitT/TauT family transport system substrate-binding protein
VRARRPLLLPTLLALAATSLSGCFAHPRGKADRVRVALWPAISYAPLFIALDDGCFTRQGLEVETVRMSTAPATAALLAGEVDVVANFLGVGVFNAIHRGSSIRVVADKGHEQRGACSADAVLIRASLVVGGKMPATSDLRGMRVGVLDGTAEQYLLERLLATGGLTLADLAVHPLMANAKLQALRRAQVDLVCWTEPNLTLAVDSGAARVYVGAANVIPHSQWAFLLYGRSFLVERPEVGERFMTGYLEGVRRYLLGKTAHNVEIVARHTGVPEELVRRACWTTIRPDGMIDAASVLDFERWAVARGYQDAVVPVAEFWEPRFAQRAAERLASTIPR